MIVRKVDGSEVSSFRFKINVSETLIKGPLPSRRGWVMMDSDPGRVFYFLI